MRNWINLCEASLSEGIGDFTGGKFWLDTNSDEIYVVPEQKHHAIQALHVPAMREALQRHCGDNFSRVADHAEFAFSNFKADGGNADEPYLKVHDMFLSILFKLGFVRGDAQRHTKSLNLNYITKFDRSCQKMASLWGAEKVFIEVDDLEDATYLADHRLEQWLSGRSIKLLLGDRDAELD